jgi:protein-tyrosine-phosphatase
MSSRTRDALRRFPELGEQAYGAHRGHQLTSDDIEWADAILASEALNVAFVRRHFPDATAKAVLFGQFLRDAPLDQPFAAQISYVASLDPESRFDVEDPAGKDQSAYDRCAVTLWEMAQVFATLVEAP